MTNTPRTKDPHAVALGRKGGLKGGKARALALSPEQRSDMARHAARVRHGWCICIACNQDVRCDDRTHECFNKPRTTP